MECRDGRADTACPDSGLCCIKQHIDLETIDLRHCCVQSASQSSNAGVVFGMKSCTESGGHTAVEKNTMDECYQAVEKLNVCYVPTAQGDSLVFINCSELNWPKSPLSHH